MNIEQYINTIQNCDCLEFMKQLPDNCIDSIVTDPPYGLTSITKRFGKLGSKPAQFGKDGSFSRLSKGFMGKEWDGSGIEYNIEMWQQCLRILKPGSYLLSFAGTRTQHRIATAIENAGFEIRDMIAWIYGSGFPKSLNIGKGWGTALKPAFEPITLARKPLSEKTVAENCLKWGTGGINIDGCRIGNEQRTYKGMSKKKSDVGIFRDDNWQPKDVEITVNGRFPANIIFDEESVKLLDEQSNNNVSRFFYCPKSSKSERNMGLDGMEKKPLTMDKGNGLGRVCSICGTPQLKPCDCENNSWILPAKQVNNHPTVKPVSLMRYLCRLITPKNGIVLDPFAGSGSTCIGAVKEGFNYIGIELNSEYVEIARKRVEYAKNEIESEIKEDNKQQKLFKKGEHKIW